MRPETLLPLLAITVTSTVAVAQSSSDELSKPVLLRAGGDPIDVTVGHAAPYVMDVDGDGVRDLLVGEFGIGEFPVSRLPDDPSLRRMGFAEGKLRIYRNTGTNQDPEYGGFEYLEAGDEHASIPTT